MRTHLFVAKRKFISVISYEEDNESWKLERGGAVYRNYGEVITVAFVTEIEEFSFYSVPKTKTIFLFFLFFPFFGN